MTTRTNPEILHGGNSCILYDAAVLTSPDENHFNTGWLQQHARLQPTASGRGASWFIDYTNPDGTSRHWVLRHYLRGGMVARCNRDLYLAWHAEQTRAWKEWRLLHHMRTLNLPVPQPVAARAHWPAGQFSGFYRADILLERIPQCKTLSDIVQRGHLADAQWHAIGQCLRNFHAHDIYHADLNANNILIDARQQVYLIDFDRCRITDSATLKAGNLARLHRSLEKLQGLHPVFHFTAQNWHVLLAGYADRTTA